MKKFRRGLVVGKFAPLHKGHEHLIRTASANCDNLYILSYSNPEFGGSEPEKREHWLNALFGDARSIVLTAKSAMTDFGLELPHNSANDDEHRAFVADVWRSWGDGSLDAVFTSENYGDGFALFLSKALAGSPEQGTVEHVLVDLERKVHSVSGTVLRSNIHELRHHLSPLVYSSFVRRICFVGAESTGKSTLSKLLAERFNTACVEEYGRTLWSEKGGNLEFKDMLQIAETHIKEEEFAAGRSFKYLFVDTTPLTTLLYSYNLFSKADERLVALADRSYDLTFLCYPDFPLVQDGTRKDEAFRRMQHEQHLAQLSAMGIIYIPLKGSLDKRLDRVVSAIKEIVD